MSEIDEIREAQRGRIPPHDDEIEQGLIGTMMLSTADRRSIMELGLVPDDFYKPLHRAIYRAMIDLHTEGAAIDRIMLRERMKRDDIGITVDDATIEHLRRNALVTGFVGAVKVVQRAATSRRAIALLDRALESAWDNEPTEVLDVLQRSDALLRPEGADVTPPTGASALAAEDHNVDWIVPGWLARQEVVLIVAEGGTGKTTLLNQMATCLASAIHPWERSLYLARPLIVLVFDFQDSRGARGRAVQSMLRYAGRQYPSNRGEPDTLFYELRKQGCDLTNPTDQRWFEAKVRAVAPDVIVAGPLYNMVKGAPGRPKTSEETAEMAATFLDELITRHGCALFLEAHAPHGDDLRVRGSKMWEDWAGWGLGLVDGRDEGRRTFRIRRFRGDREADRQWPTGWIQGFPDHWPWEAEGVPPLQDHVHPEQQKF